VVSHFGYLCGVSIHFGLDGLWQLELNFGWLGLGGHWFKRFVCWLFDLSEQRLLRLDFLDRS
jgi:hypothetical protein